MKKNLFFFLILVASVIHAQGNIPITFKVNMSVQLAEDNFDPAADSIFIKGNFQTDVGDESNWSGTTFLAHDEDGDRIYELVIDFPDTTDANEYQFKFVNRRNGSDAFEAFEPPRALIVAAPAMELPVVYFNNDSLVTTYVTNTLNFSADLSDIYGAGLGFFDPATDSIIVQGLTWNGSVTLLSPGTDRKLVEDPFSPAIFKTTLAIRAIEGDSAEWKTQAYPGDHFFNGGWEVQNNRKFYIVGDGQTVDVDVFKPSVFPVKDPLPQDVSILFQVDISNAFNRYNDTRIDLSTVEFVGIKGQDSVLGSWAGAWVPADTVRTDTSGCTIWALNDSGLNGDKAAGDNIWSRIIIFPAGGDGGPSLYKYGIQYAGATAASATNPMNNEFDSGDHYINIANTSQLIEVLNRFGTYMPITSVKQIDDNIPASYSLEQNYPNPFNPETTIKYSVPKTSMIQLAIFNILGEKVTELINEEQKTGTYEVKFDASRLSSGVYFYKLSGDGISLTKKMLLMK